MVGPWWEDQGYKELGSCVRFETGQSHFARRSRDDEYLGTVRIVLG